MSLPELMLQCCLGYEMSPLIADYMLYEGSGFHVEHV